MSKIKTTTVPVRIFTSDFVIEGNAHTKPDGLYTRISDLLNLSEIKFLPITDAKYRLRESETREYIDSACLVVRIESIEILDILEDIG